MCLFVFWGVGVGEVPVLTMKSFPKPRHVYSGVNPFAVHGVQPHLGKHVRLQSQPPAPPAAWALHWGPPLVPPRSAGGGAAVPRAISSANLLCSFQPQAPLGCWWSQSLAQSSCPRMAIEAVAAAGEGFCQGSLMPYWLPCGSTPMSDPCSLQVCQTLPKDASRP